VSPPLLLLNGYAATGADWDPAFLDALGDSFEVIAPDPRGMGGAELGEGELTIAGLADDALARLDADGVERATVAGWSMGGFVAQELAARAPERVTALALLATDPGGEAVLADPDVWARLIDHSGEPTEQARRMLDLLFPPGFAAQVFDRFGDVVAQARASLDPAALTAQERAMDAWHASPGAERMAAISAPTAIAAGELDQVIPAANAGLLGSGISDSRVELLPGCGHAFMAQQPQRAAELIASLPSG
jgi:3-oxoadipate enol-lactonase